MIDIVFPPMLGIPEFHPPSFLRVVEPVFDLVREVDTVPRPEQTTVIESKLGVADFGLFAMMGTSPLAKASIQEIASISTSAACT